MQRDVRLLRANEHSRPPTEAELYELPVILKPYPQLASSSQHGGGLVSRPSPAAGRKYEDVSKAYIRAVHSVLTREKIPSAAAADLEKELVEITGFSKGPPKSN